MANRENSPPGVRRQSHGGAWLPGGQPGDRGGSGAPPSVIRSRCRESFLSRIAIADRIADDESQGARGRLKALERASLLQPALPE